MGNIQTLLDYLLPIKNWVLPEIFELGRVGYSLSHGYGQWPSLESFRPCLVLKKWSLITHHSVFITHHLKYLNFIPHLFGTYFQFLITQFFLLFVGPMPEHYVISFVSLPASPSLSSFHFLPLQSPLPYYSHWSCPLSLSFLMYTHINKNNPIPNLQPNHHKHTNTNEYKHKLIGTHRCSNQNPQMSFGHENEFLHSESSINEWKKRSRCKWIGCTLIGKGPAGFFSFRSRVALPE